MFRYVAKEAPRSGHQIKERSDQPARERSAAPQARSDLLERHKKKVTRRKLQEESHKKKSSLTPYKDQKLVMLQMKLLPREI